ncbi:hypothetical protein [Lonepinella sp. BR2904]|uniref:hypothetical protein n=1 Tax=Lonepinella sp. BR2904 TaxID=3434551 RepID=UPI003F6DB6AD
MLLKNLAKSMIFIILFAFGMNAVAGERTVKVKDDWTLFDVQALIEQQAKKDGVIFSVLEKKDGLMAFSYGKTNYFIVVEGKKISWVDSYNDEVTLSQVNKFNFKYSYLKAVQTDNGKLRFEIDNNCSIGCSSEQLLKNFATLQNAADLYSKLD